jgi:hypothetical protein
VPLGPAVGEIIQVTLRGLYDGQLIENVINMRELVEATVDEALALSVEALRLTILARLNNGYVSLPAIYKRMTPVPLDEQFVPMTGATTGSGTGTACQSTVACVLTYRTGAAGKTHRGRTYLAPLSYNITSPDRLNSDGLTAMNGLATTLMDQFGVDGSDLSLRLGIYSKVIGGAHPYTLAGWQQVTQVIPQTILGNQRRRRVGVGA